MGCSKTFCLIADYRKHSQELGQSWKYIPIEVVRSAYVPIQKRIEAIEGGTCKLRAGSGLCILFFVISKFRQILDDNLMYVKFSLHFFSRSSKMTKNYIKITSYSTF